MKNTLLLFIVTFVALQMQGQDLSIIDSIQAKGTAIQSLESHIRRHSVKPDTTEIEEGTFYYVNPNKISTYFDNGDYFIINENRMKADIGILHGRFKLNRNKTMRSISHIFLYGVQGRCREFCDESNYNIQLDAEDGYHIVQFTTKKRHFLGLGYRQVSFYYDQKSLTIKQIVLIDYGGIVETYTLSDILLDVSIEENVFEL